MTALGLALALLGFVLSVFSLGMTSNVTVRMAMVIAGIVVSLVGIIGVINPSYMKNAIWRK
jgi:hypothetical protein